MKILSIILSFYIVVLNVQPLMEMIDFGIDETCLSFVHNDLSKTDNDEDGCNDLCNPFMSCSTCLGCTIPVVGSFLEPLEVFQSPLTFYNQTLSLQYSPSIWQPPKIG